MGESSGAGPSPAMLTLDDSSDLLAASVTGTLMASKYIPLPHLRPGPLS